MYGLGLTGCFHKVNTFIYNTVETVGTRALVKTNSDPESGRIQSWNILDGWGYLYANDGVGFQSNQSKSVGNVRTYNWFIRADKKGHRYDGPAEGHGYPLNAIGHHMVSYRGPGVAIIKGDYSEHYHYIDIANTDEKEKGGIQIRKNKETGEGNEHTILKNSAAESINNIPPWRPIPGDHSNNWDAKRDGGSILKMIPAANLLDFRPRKDAPLVNAGVEISGINDEYLGPAPDIGAYEWGDDTYWIPGRRTEKASFPIPRNGAENLPLNRDLIFKHGLNCHKATVYVSTNKENIENATSGSSKSPGNANIYAGEVASIELDSGRNIVTPTMLMGNPNNFDPAPYLLVDDPSVELKKNTTFFWRVDAIKENGEMVKGDVWKFTTIKTERFKVSFRLYESTENGLNKSKNTQITINRDYLIATDSLGKTYVNRFARGKKCYIIDKKGFGTIMDTVNIVSDTIICDTLYQEKYAVKVEVKDKYTNKPIPESQLKFNEMPWTELSDGVLNYNE